MPTLTSTTIDFNDGGVVGDAHIIEMTPLVLPYPAAQWYTQTGDGYFYALEWDDGASNYVVIRKPIRTQLTLH